MKQKVNDYSVSQETNSCVADWELRKPVILSAIRNEVAVELNVRDYLSRNRVHRLLGKHESLAFFRESSNSTRS